MVTTAITEGVNLAFVSKTASHRTLSTTANIYGHLTRQAARQAVDAVANHSNAKNAATIASPPTRPSRARSRQDGKAA